jgi:hypothetical protein
MTIDTYYFDHQIANYIVQFMNVFSGMVVKTGKRADGTEKDIIVPIQYGSRDRVVSAILSDNTQNKPLRLPVMSCHIDEIGYAMHRHKGVGVTRVVKYVPRGGLLHEDAKTIHQLMPNPYDIMMSLSIYTSNVNTQHQILEQLFLLFDPILQLQTSDSTFDWTKITKIVLRNIQYEENYPIGTDRRMIVTTINFEMPIWISGPSELKNELIKKIYARIGAVSSLDVSSADIVQQMNDQNINYDLLSSADVVDVN